MSGYTCRSMTHVSIFSIRTALLHTSFFSLLALSSSFTSDASPEIRNTSVEEERHLNKVEIKNSWEQASGVSGGAWQIGVPCRSNDMDAETETYDRNPRTAGQWN
jgi:hypothetical protein